MKASISDKPKKRGRPATGRDPMVGARMGPEFLSLVDAWAERHKVPRSEAIRRLIQIGLEADDGEKKD